MTAPGRVASPACAPGHGVSKRSGLAQTLIAGQGGTVYAHRCVTDTRRSSVRIDPTQPIFRQAHLIHSESLARLAASGFGPSAT